MDGPPAPTTPFWIDSINDERRASYGVSRYALYVRDRQHEFDAIADFHDELTVPFAVHAWTISQSPIMGEPFVSSHQRIAAAVLQRSEFDGGLILAVELIIPLPACLAQTRPEDGGFFRDRPRTWSGEYLGVSDQDIQRAPYLMGKASLLTAVPIDTLRPVRVMPQGDALEMAAHTMVRTLVPLLNRCVHPVIKALEAG